MNVLILSVVCLFVFYVFFVYVGSEIVGLKGFFIGVVIGNLFMVVVVYKWFIKEVDGLSELYMKECYL